jgi:hypothetical protein
MHNSNFGRPKKKKSFGRASAQPDGEISVRTGRADLDTVTTCQLLSRLDRVREVVGVDPHVIEAPSFHVVRALDNSRDTGCDVAA